MRGGRQEAATGSRGVVDLQVCKLTSFPSDVPIASFRQRVIDLCRDISRSPDHLLQPNRRGYEEEYEESPRPALAHIRNNHIHTYLSIDSMPQRFILGLTVSSAGFAAPSTPQSLNGASADLDRNRSGAVSHRQSDHKCFAEPPPLLDTPA
jgi:hypothetical protein